MAHSMNIKVIAEGVETKEQLELKKLLTLHIIWAIGIIRRVAYEK